MEKIAVETLAGTAMLTGLMGWAPIALMIPAAIWYCVKLYEYFKRGKL